MTKPYTYTNHESDHLAVYADRTRPGVVRLATEGRRDPATFTLVSLGSEEAVELAKEILAAAGVDDHVVVATADIDAESARSYSQGVEATRERAAEAVQRAWPRAVDPRPQAEQCGDVVRAVRDLEVATAARQAAKSST